MDGLAVTEFGDHVLRIAAETRNPEYARMHRRFFRDELDRQRGIEGHNPNCPGCVELKRVLVELELLIPPERECFP